MSEEELRKYTLIFIQEGYIQEGQPQFGQKIKKFIYMMTSLLLNKAGLRLNSDSNLLIYKKECILNDLQTKPDLKMSADAFRAPLTYYV